MHDGDAKNVGLYSNEIIDWVVNNVDEFSNPMLKASLYQGIYINLKNLLLE